MPVTLKQAEFGLSDMRSRLERGLAQRHLLEGQRAEKEAALVEIRADVEIWRQVQMLFTKTSEFARQQLKARIEETVTAALQVVFEDDGLRFEIEVREVGGKPVADWLVVSRYKDTEISNEPEDAKGGGIVDCVSLALRLAMMELSRPKPGGPILLDEPGKMVSAEFAPNLAQFLSGYARRTGRAVIMITHNDALAAAADKSYRVNKSDDGVSQVVVYGG